VWLRTKVTKGAGSKAAGLAMAYKLIEPHSKTGSSWNGPKTRRRKPVPRRRRPRPVTIGPPRPDTPHP
jgi:hypothetical protein